MKTPLNSALVAVLLVAGSAFAQLPTIVVSSQPYVPLTGAPTVTFIGTGSFSDPTDEGNATLPLQFTFPYFGTNYTSVTVNTNGFLMPGTTGCTSGCYSVTEFPRSATPNNVIAGFWDDFEIVSPGVVRYRSSPSEFVVEFSGVRPYLGFGATVTFQIRLSPAGTFSVHYGSITGTTSDWSGSAGFENAAGSQGANLLPGCTNNCTTTHFPAGTLYTVGEPAEADLGVASVTIANFQKAMDGNLTFDVNARLRNYGRTPATGFGWKAYLSTDQVLNLDGGTDVLVADQPAALSLPASNAVPDGGLSQVDVTAAAATTVAPPTGEYYVLVQVDPAEVVMEASEGNNVGATTTAFVQGTDLVATSVSGPSTTGGGNVENIAVEFFNRGTTSAGAVDFRILLSADGTWDASDFVIYSGNRTVTGAQTIAETIAVTIPANVPNGTFSYLLQIDPANAVVEASETNNVVASATTVEARRADLVAQAVSFLDPVTNLETTQARFGEAARMRVGLRNVGFANASNFKVALVLSRDSNLSLLSDRYVCDATVASAPAGSSLVEATIECPLPLTDAAGVAYVSGQYFLFGVVDATGAIFESNKGNNSLQVGPVRITAPGPDLAVVSITAPATGGVGEIIPVVRNLRNLGNLDAPQAAYRFYASANEIITTDDVLLKIVDGMTEADEGLVTLAAGAGDSATQLVRLPGTMAPGSYYVGCLVDPAHAVTADLDGSNNGLASRPMQVAQSSLRIASGQLPDAVIGRPYLFRLAATGVVGTPRWSIDASQGKPDWLSIGESDGLLSGTPTGAAGSEVAGVTVVLEDGGRQAAARLVLRVLSSTAGLEVTTVAIPAIVNSSSTQFQYLLGAAGGVRPYVWRLAGGALPIGLALSAEGLLFGSPRSAANGSTPVTVEVLDAVGARAQRTLSLRLIAPGSIAITTLAMPDALMGTVYLQDVGVANVDGSPLSKPLKWSVTGLLPDGVGPTPLTEILTIGGTPTRAGRFNFTVAVEDAAGRSDSVEYSINVEGARYKVTAALPEVLRPGEAVTGVAFAVSPTGAVSYRVVSGSLPPGLEVTAGGELTGTVDAEGAIGTWTFVVEARDASNVSGLAPFTLRVEREARKEGCSTTDAGLSLSSLLVMGLAGLRRRRGLRLGAALAVLVAVVLPRAALAQQYQVVGPTAATYAPLTGATNVSVGTAIALPFNVPFFDTQIASVAMSRYGYLAVGGADATESWNEEIPHDSSFAPRTFLAPWWDALLSGSTGAYRYVITGSAPYRVATFEWNQIGANVSTAKISFQVQLFETTGRIRFAYATAAPGSVSASVGIQKDLGVGVPGLACTNTTGFCSSAAYPAGQAIDFFRPPELEITALSVPQVGYAGVAFPVSATVRNSGGREATTVQVRFYLSTDTSLDPMTDTVLGTATLASVESTATAQASSSAPLPASAAQQPYYVFAVVDPDNTVTELAETNNRSSPVMMTVGPPTPDLLVAGFTVGTTAQPGATLQVTRSIQNVGNAASTSAKYTVFLSDNAVVSVADRALTPVGQVGALTPGQVDTGMESVTLPSDLLPGPYWLGLCVNYDAAAATFGTGEVTIVNNCYTASTAVQVSTTSVAITTTSLPGATQFAPYGLRLQATGGSGQYAWELTGGALPPGLTLSAAGDLVGSPSTAGAFAFDVKVTSNMVSDTRSLSLQVAAGGIPLVIVDQRLSAAEFGRAYDARLIAVGGKAPYTWSLVAGETLPPGLALAPDGRLEGRASGAGDYTFAVEVRDAANSTASRELELRVVTPTSLSIATTAFQAGSVGREYLQPLVAVGGKVPYAWSVARFQALSETPTDLPGEALTAFPEGFGVGIDDGAEADYLSGTPRRAGLFLLTLKVVDGAGTEDTATLLLRVTYRDGLAITTTQLPDAFVNQAYRVRLSHNGGTEAEGIVFSEPCVNQSVRPGEYECAPVPATQKLPAGLTLAADGTIAGAPQVEAGTYTFLARVVDAQGRQDVRGLAIRVRPDFATENAGGCSGTGLEPSLLGLLALGLALRRRAR